MINQRVINQEERVNLRRCVLVCGEGWIQVLDSGRGGGSETDVPTYRISVLDMFLATVLSVLKRSPLQFTGDHRTTPTTFLTSIQKSRSPQ